jgi:acetyl-CoA carboxylase biotin carboxyl carrier protein
MDIRYLKNILKIIEDANINEIEIEEGETKLRIVKNAGTQQLISYNSPSVLPQNIQTGISSTMPHIETKPEAAPIEQKYHEIKSPIVGTFYKAPSPDAESYVRVGQKISAGTVLCIVEAMKLMNEIESDISGTIIKICCENGQPVEYNQVLFQIEKD